MNKRQLFKEVDGDHVHAGWACGACDKMYRGDRAADAAQKCCVTPRCGKCGGDAISWYYLVCSACRDAARLEKILAGPLLSLEEAGDAAFFDWDNDGFYTSWDDWIDKQVEDLFWSVQEFPDARPDPVVAHGEIREWKLDVMAWVENEEDRHVEGLENAERRALEDFHAEILQAQAIVDRIKAQTVWEPSGKFIDTRPLHARIMEEVREGLE